MHKGNGFPLTVVGKKIMALLPVQVHLQEDILSVSRSLILLVDRSLGSAMWKDQREVVLDVNGKPDPNAMVTLITEDTTELVAPSIELVSIEPPAQIGVTSEVTLSFTNPLQVPMTDVKLEIEGSRSAINAKHLSFFRIRSNEHYTKSKLW